MRLLSLCLCALLVAPVFAEEAKDLVERTFPFLRRAEIPTKFKVGVKKYALIAVWNEQIFAVKDELNENNRFVAENVTVSPTLMDKDNYFELDGETTKFYVKGSKETYYVPKTKDGYDFKTNTGITDSRVWKIQQDADNQTYYDLWIDKRFLGFDFENKKDNFARYTSDTYPKTRLYEYDTSVQPIGTVNIGTEEGYGTLFTAKAYVMPQGVTGCTITEADAEAGDLTIKDVFRPGDIVPANTALLLKGRKGDYLYFAPADEPAVVDENESADLTEGNLLLGLSEEGTTVPPAGKESNESYLYYKLYYLTEADGTNRRLGFFWGAEQGAPFTVPGGKAYLALSSGQAYNIKGFVLPEVTPTAISTTTVVNGHADPAAPVYNLAGRRLPAGQSLAKGVYIRDGRKFVVK